MIETRRRSLVPIVLVVLLVAAIARTGTPLSAQGAATIAGAVRDSTGSLVPGVTVTVTDAATGAERTARDRCGRPIPAHRAASGRYEVRAVLAGFRTEMRSVELVAATWSSTSP